VPDKVFSHQTRIVLYLPHIYFRETEITCWGGAGSRKILINVALKTKKEEHFRVGK
jgi:hypothetical protein